MRHRGELTSTETDAPGPYLSLVTFIKIIISTDDIDEIYRFELNKTTFHRINQVNSGRAGQSQWVETIVKMYQSIQ